MLNLGIGLYDLCVVGTFFLAYAIWNRAVWLEKPAFALYVAFCGVRMLVLHPAFKSNAGGYAEMFWYFQVAALPFLGATVGELFGKKFYGSVFGCWAALMAGSLMVATKVDMLGGNGQSALNHAEMVVDVIRYSGLALAFVSLLAVRGVSGIASGLSVSVGFSSLALLARGDLRYTSTAAWIVALFLWLDWVRTYRAESRATTCRPNLRSSRKARGVVFSGTPQPCK